VAFSWLALSARVPWPDVSLITQMMAFLALTATWPGGMRPYCAVTVTDRCSIVSWPRVTLDLDSVSRVFVVALDTVSVLAAERDATKLASPL
jgi:hypothetical protein